MSYKSLATFGLTATLAVATVLPAAAATRHVHRAPATITEVAPQGAPVTPNYVSPADPLTAGSNCGDTDCGLHYNRLNDY